MLIGKDNLIDTYKKITYGYFYYEIYQPTLVSFLQPISDSYFLKFCIVFYFKETVQLKQLQERSAVLLLGFGHTGCDTIVSLIILTAASFFIFEMSLVPFQNTNACYFLIVMKLAMGMWYILSLLVI